MKTLIIRFSSFGDILQCLPAAQCLKQKYPDSELHWITRHDSFDLLKMSPCVDEVHSFHRSKGVIGLIKLAKTLSTYNFEMIYDAHNNLRSRIFVWAYRLYSQKKFIFIRRSKQRLKRILLFKFRINLFPKPYKGSMSYLEPLKKIKIKPEFITQKLKSKETKKPFLDYICLAPSAAWEMKRWPIEYWKQLIELCKDQNFVLLGGPEDKFIEDIVNYKDIKSRCANMAGKLSWPETTHLIQHSKLLISNDTGSLHLGDIQGVPTVALMGPTAFGAPSSNSSTTLSAGLSCQPCSKDGRGKCIQKTYKLCLYQLTPHIVKKAIKDSINV